MCRAQWPRQTPACAGWEFVKRRREPARPGLGSVWAGDLASERAESPSHTDPDSLRDPCLIFLLQDRRKAPLGFSDQCPSVVHSVRLVTPPPAARCISVESRHSRRLPVRAAFVSLPSGCPSPPGCLSSAPCTRFADEPIFCSHGIAGTSTTALRSEGSRSVALKREIGFLCPVIATPAELMSIEPWRKTPSLRKFARSVTSTRRRPGILK